MRTLFILLNLLILSISQAQADVTFAVHGGLEGLFNKDTITLNQKNLGLLLNSQEIPSCVSYAFYSMGKLTVAYEFLIKGQNAILRISQTGSSRGFETPMTSFEVLLQDTNGYFKKSNSASRTNNYLDVFGMPSPVQIEDALNREAMTCKN